MPVVVGAPLGHPARHRSALRSMTARSAGLTGRARSPPSPPGRGVMGPTFDAVLDHAAVPLAHGVLVHAGCRHYRIVARAVRDIRDQALAIRPRCDSGAPDTSPDTTAPHRSEPGLRLAGQPQHAPSAIPVGVRFGSQDTMTLTSVPDDLTSLQEGTVHRRPQWLSWRKVRPSRVETAARQRDAPPASTPRCMGNSGQRHAGHVVATVAATLLTASVVLPVPVMAQEEGGSVLDAISDLFSQPDNETVRVPKRRTQSPVSPAPTAPVQAPVQPPPAAAPAPETVSVPKRRSSAPAETDQEPVQPSPAAAPAPETVSVPEQRPAPLAQPQPAPGPSDRPAERPDPGEGAGQSQVFRATEDLIAEIEVLRAELAISHFPPRAELIEGRAAVHVYAKSLEVLGKVIQVQRRLGLTPARMGHLPAKIIDSTDVLEHIEDVLRELRSIKTQMGIDGRIEAAPLSSGRTSSMNYRNLANASLLLDGLIGRTLTPADVYRHALSAFDELHLVAAAVGVSLNFELPSIEQEIAPADVAAQILRATYKAINLQTRLQMESSQVPSMTLVRVSPSENYDATNLLLAEIARLKVHLGVTLTRANRPNLPMDQQSKDVFALVALIAGNIDTVAAAVGN